ncbi:MAG: hypothetical protein BM562_14775 [Alphaproteobacteria bacterium MedPE-SWcel]|nr:MAG: hypothetical protein BM562_14775 [Alphaproteobacteria bacterium MedPE-SWcel]
MYVFGVITGYHISNGISQSFLLFSTDLLDRVQAEAKVNKTNHNGPEGFDQLTLLLFWNILILKIWKIGIPIDR